LENKENSLIVFGISKQNYFQQQQQQQVNAKSFSFIRAVNIIDLEGERKTITKSSIRVRMPQDCIFQQPHSIIIQTA